MAIFLGTDNFTDYNHPVRRNNSLTARKLSSRAPVSGHKTGNDFSETATEVISIITGKMHPDHSRIEFLRSDPSERYPKYQNFWSRKWSTMAAYDII